MWSFLSGFFWRVFNDLTMKRQIEICRILTDHIIYNTCNDKLKVFPYGNYLAKCLLQFVKTGEKGLFRWRLKPISIKDRLFNTFITFLEDQRINKITYYDFFNILILFLFVYILKLILKI